jgi:hypothetical protein
MYAWELCVKPKFRTFFQETPVMLYLGIDQHKRQLTVNLRSEDGSVILKRQVGTQWEKVRAFFADLAEKAAFSPSLRSAA